MKTRWPLVVKIISSVFKGVFKGSLLVNAHNFFFVSFIYTNNEDLIIFLHWLIYTDTNPYVCISSPPTGDC